ncbi:MAG TPA: SapC family protein [Sphingomonas sp.]|nr:SapC family protein [Sphingomonas sp.]
MADLELLNVQNHARLRAIKRLPTPHFVQIVPTEFAAAAASRPIVLTKDQATGRFYAGAISGFGADENLIAEPATSDTFEPLDLVRQGFFISPDGIAIMPTHPRFGSAGDLLFDEDGQPGDLVRHMQRVLGQLKLGVSQSEAFIAALLDHKLIEPMDVSLHFDDGEKLRLEGLYTVSLDTLHDLDDNAALELFRQGHLQLIYTMVGSLKQIPVLAERRNRRLAAGTANG